jgi:hypothetical protein
LKENENTRFLKEINMALDERGSSGKGLVSLTERVTHINARMQERGKNSNGEFDVDMTCSSPT